MTTVTPHETTLVDAPNSAVADASTQLDTIGIELEYPIAADTDDIPVAYSENSRDLRRELGRRETIHADGAQNGTMTGDHVGAEIVSQQMQLHSAEPERWYNEMIRFAQDLGYPFSPSGQGATNFGLHMHVSSLPEEKAEALYELCQEDWFRLFVCTSLSERSADPWRHGGVTSRDLDGERSFRSQYIVNDYPGDGHYEWRLPEPMLPEHLSMVMHFLRTLEVGGMEEAREYAEGAVFGADQRLTGVQQFQVLDQRDGWRESATSSQHRTDSEVAERIISILDDAL